MSRSTLVLAGMLVVASGFAAAAPAPAATFTVSPETKESEVVFASKAPMESFEGKTRRISGFLEFDPASLGDTITFRMEVDLADLDTGIPLRNRHMRENHLHTDRYPKAIFHGGRVSDASGSSLEPGRRVTCTLSGTFELHGVSRRISVPAEAVRREDGALAVVARFPVALADYGIDLPKFLMLKLDEIQRVTVSLVARPGP